MAKLIFIDTETTGLDHRKNGIWQIAGLIEIDGKVVERFNFFMNPGDVEITPEALEVGGVTMEDLESYDPQEVVFKDFCEMLGEYIDKFNKEDKAFLIAYNSRFDDGFIREWFLRNGDKFFGSWFYSNFIDVHTLVGYVTMDIRPKINSFKLMNIVELFGITLKDAHDASADVEATYELFKALKSDHLIVKL